MQPQPPHNSPTHPSHLGQISTLTFPCSLDSPPTTPSPILYYKNPTLLNKQYTHDIVPGVYEGGFQLWECEIQFLKKLFQMEELRSLVESKTVVEIGCGHGLLGVAAMRLGAKLVTLQDYNFNVIEELTKPTLQLNGIDSNNNKITFLHGDWSSLKHPQGYDVILGSELTYRQQNYQKIISFIFNNMKSTGKCILANKSYYFGVGGNLGDFKAKLEEKGLQWRTVCKIVPKSGGNKKEIMEITFKQQ